MNTATGSIIVLIAWGMTIALVYSLLNGPFNEQTMCETTCFGVLYWGAIVLAVVGTLISLVQAVKSDKTIINIGAFLLGLFLCAKLFGVMVIGTMVG
ncbi:MAG: hypothetical protein AAF372_01340 [Pseudomonadota bacterium]